MKQIRTACISLILLATTAFGSCNKLAPDKLNCHYFGNKTECPENIEAVRKASVCVDKHEKIRISSDDPRLGALGSIPNGGTTPTGVFFLVGKYPNEENTWGIILRDMVTKKVGHIKVLSCPEK